MPQIPGRPELKSTSPGHFFKPAYPCTILLTCPEASAMRSTFLRLAESITTKPLNLREASITLLPPKPYVCGSKVFAELCPEHVQALPEASASASYLTSRDAVTRG